MAAFLQTDDSGAELSVSVLVQGKERGLVQLLVFEAAAGFPDQPSKAIRREAAPVRGGEVVFHFTGLKPGNYAISAFHDEDGDGKMRKNIFGVPKDLYGFSNDVRNPFSAPSFQSAAVQLPPDGLAISFSLK